MNANLYALIENRNTDHERPFLIDAAGSTISYGELFTCARRYASAFAAAGLAPGDRVAVQTDKTVESVFLHWGALAAGCVYLPLNTAYTPAEVDYFLRDAEPAMLICRPEVRQHLEPHATAAGIKHVHTLGADETGSIVDLASQQPAGFDTIERRPDDLAALLYTSGTTGRSKGAMLTHGNLSSNALSLIETWRITDADRLLHALPIYHTHGLLVGLGTVALSGASLIYLPKFDPDQVLRRLPQATMMMGVPTFYSRLLAHPAFDRDTTAHMRVFISGSAPLSSQVHKDFQDRTGHAILERYGMTETGMNTSNPYDGERRPGTVGFPLPDVDVIVADPETGRPLPNGEPGSIEVRGPNVSAGYWRAPEKTKESFRDNGFFITGDLGHIDADGYVSIAGRDKDLIISGGLNVYPAEIEMAIDAIDGVAESAVIAAPHPDFGEVGVAVVVCQGGCAVKEPDIVNQLSQHLARFKLPKAIRFVDELPRNTMGKVQKNELRERYKSTFG